MKPREEHLEIWLKEILPLPTAPLHEEVVAARVKAFARERNLRCREDAAGNLVVEYRHPGRRTRAVGFTSHMDHPGFEVVQARGRRATLRLLGGVNEATLRGAGIRLVTAGGSAQACVTSLRMAKQRYKEDTLLKVSCSAPVEPGDWGYFDLVPLSLARGRIRSKALDNVLSVALILALLDGLVARRQRAHVYGVFTVAEEIGFGGAARLIEGRLLPKRLPLVVLEASRAMPSFEIGAGPVIRVGDRLSVFDDALTRWLVDTADSLAVRDRDFRYQRALMPGGFCEASLFQLAGWPSCAMALALANYHNMGPRGAAAEWVSRRDAEQMLQLLEALALWGPNPQRQQRVLADLKGRSRRFARRLDG